MRYFFHLGTFCSILILSGCSIIGYFGGRGIDNSLSDYKAQEKYMIGKTKSGDEIIIHLKDGISIQGTFKEINLMNQESYESMYNEYKREYSSLSVLPDIGDTIGIRTISMDYTNLSYHGIGYKYHRTYGRKSSNKIDQRLFINCLDNHRDESLLLFLDEIKEISCRNSNIIYKKELKSLAIEDVLPLNSHIFLDVNGGSEKIQFNKISYYELSRSKQLRWLGLALGLGVDACMIAIAIAMSQFSVGFN